MVLHVSLGALRPLGFVYNMIRKEAHSAGQFAMTVIMTCRHQLMNSGFRQPYAKSLLCDREAASGVFTLTLLGGDPTFALYPGAYSS